MFKNRCIYKLLLLTTLLLIQSFSFAQEGYKPVCDELIEKGKAALAKNQYSNSLQLLTQARSIAKNNNWSKQEFIALNNIGANYYMLLEYGEALSHYLEAYKIAIKELGSKEKMTVLNNIAILYFEEEDYQKSNDYFKKAYEIAKERKDLEKVAMYAINLGNSANGTSKYGLGRRYFNEAISLFPQKEEFLNLSKVGLAVCDLYQGRPQQARKSAEQLLRTIKDLNFNETRLLLYAIISRAYLNENKLDNALDYANKILAYEPSHKMKIEAFRLLSEINFENKKYQTAFLYKDSIVIANKEIEKNKDRQLYESSKVKLGIVNYKNQLILNEAKSANERKIFFAMIAGLLIVVGFVIWSLRNLAVKHKQKKIIAERDKQILELELIKKKNDALLLEKHFEENKTALLLEQERLKNEIEHRNRKLSAKALYLSGRNQMLGDVLPELSRIANISNNNSLVTHIETIKNHLNLNNDWNDFVTHFEEVNQGFLKTLKARHPDLSANDMRFISYVYMNLNNKEIASLLNISQDSSRKRKERIATKLNLKNGVNLYDYLASLK